MLLRAPQWNSVFLVTTYWELGTWQLAQRSGDPAGLNDVLGTKNFLKRKQQESGRGMDSRCFLIKLLLEKT